MSMSVLFCADPLDPRGVERHFAREASVVRDLGGVAAVVDHGALQHGDPESAVQKVPHGLGAAWYRGWMVTGVEYESLAKALESRGVTLITRPEDYRRAHELPGWLEVFDGLTPQSVWLPLSVGEIPDPQSLAELVTPLPAGRAIIKDYVKSRKHEWDEACFVPDLRDTEALHRTTRRMLELQGEFLSGGLVVRAFEPYRTEEARVWWIDGEPVFVGPHPDSPRAHAEPALEEVGSAVRRLGCRFITTDLAQREDGAWRVVEVGDGQVSDLPSSVDPADLYEQFPG
ncbi:MAG: hypothetical protein JWN00_1616 [Actinomycetia bacterium]|nr:hypothetical protein [Actinomycetes bacterium]